MLFSNVDIKDSILNGQLHISPFDSKKIQPASYDVGLGGRFRVRNPYTEATIIDPRSIQGDLTVETSVDYGKPFILHPGAFVLGETIERFVVGDGIACRLEGKSSLGRLGLMVHSTAGFIDPGFEGGVTLELSNISDMPIMLFKGMSVGQLCVFELKTPTTTPYGSSGLNSKYQDQSGPTPSRYYLNGA